MVLRRKLGVGHHEIQIAGRSRRTPVDLVGQVRVKPIRGVTESKDPAL
jgi:hypothetical protein